MSALIFVALAAAWAVYLVPKALKQSEDAEATRSVESFSDRLRVLDPRKAVAATAEVVEALAPRTPASVVDEAAQRPSRDQDEDEYVVEPVRLTPLQLRLRRQAARQAAARRRRVLGLLLLTLVATVALAAGGVIGWVFLVAPVALITAWLVACRLMVKKETAARTRVVKKRRTTLADQALADEDAPVVEEVAQRPSRDQEAAADEVGDNTEEIPAVGAASPSTWEPVPMTLPTYVAKATASRTVRTIDLDSTGVWSSGRNEGDSELAREAEAQRRSSKTEAEQAAERRATGS
ncbi:divisome protein SepX/GlpR [Nocardioides montaniterrae]